MSKIQSFGRFRVFSQNQRWATTKEAKREGISTDIIRFNVPWQPLGFIISMKDTCAVTCRDKRLAD